VTRAPRMGQARVSGLYDCMHRQGGSSGPLLVTIAPFSSVESTVVCSSAKQWQRLSGAEPPTVSASAAIPVTARLTLPAAADLRKIKALF
jgi:hypothetical protein